MFALLAGFHLAGIIGGVFAVPIAGVLWVLVGAAYRNAVELATPHVALGLAPLAVGTPVNENGAVDVPTPSYRGAQRRSPRLLPPGIFGREHGCKMGGGETALISGQPGVCSCTVPARRMASIASCVVSS